MTSVTIDPKPVREQEKFQQRRSDFYSLTVAQNNARLDGKTMPDDVRDELKFVQAELLARFGNDVD